MLNIAIIGAGPSGLAAAIRLSSIPSVSISVYERTETHRTAGGAINLAPNAMRLIDRLSICQETYAAGNASPTFELLSKSGSSLGFIQNVSQDGYPGIRIIRSALQSVLLKRVESLNNVKIFMGKKVSEVQETSTSSNDSTYSSDGDDSENNNHKGPVKVIFQDGTVIHADLLIGADGISSSVRSYVTGTNEVKAEYTGRTVVYGMVHNPTTIMEPKKIWSLHSTSAVLTHHGLFGYAFAEPTRSKIFWFAHDDSAEAKKDQPASGHVSKLEDVRPKFAGRFGTLFEPIPSLIDGSDEFYSWPVHMLPRMDSWSRGNVVLIGDAAHAVSPHRGQGVAMALEDIFILAKVIEKHAARHEVEKKSDGDWEFDWTQYEDIRMPRVNNLREELQNTKGNTEGKGAIGMWIRDWTCWLLLKFVPSSGQRFLAMELFDYDPDLEKV